METDHLSIHNRLQTILTHKDSVHIHMHLGQNTFSHQCSAGNWCCRIHRSGLSSKQLFNTIFTRNVLILIELHYWYWCFLVMEGHIITIWLISMFIKVMFCGDHKTKLIITKKIFVGLRFWLPFLIWKLTASTCNDNLRNQRSIGTFHTHNVPGPNTRLKCDV